MKEGLFQGIVIVIGILLLAGVAFNTHDKIKEKCGCEETKN